MKTSPQFAAVAVLWMGLQALWWVVWNDTYSACIGDYSQRNWQGVKTVGLDLQIAFAVVALVLAYVGLRYLVLARAARKLSNLPVFAVAIIYPLQLVLIVFAYDCMLAACPSEINLHDNGSLVARDLTLMLWLILSIVSTFQLLRMVRSTFGRTSRMGS